jgi:thiamine biosynthesis lipoprotein
MSAPWRKALLGLAVAGALLALRLQTTHREQTEDLLHVQRTMMGTLWNIDVMDKGDPEGARRAVEDAFAELDRIDGLMSEWKPDSPLSAINAAAGGGPVPVPAELCAILKRGVDYGTKSEGAFDITWRGMGRIWRFDDGFVPPSDDTIAKARANVNFRDLEIGETSARLKRPGMNIGLGGIAKGYAIDRALDVLTRGGFGNALVDGGGDIRVAGSKNGRPWRLGIQHPRAERGTLLGRVSITEGSLVTSGDYERFVIAGGVRYHHIIDPRTGRPARGAISASVLAPTAEQADALATAIFVLGPGKGLALARAEGVEALVIDEQGKRYMTDGFGRRFEAAPGQENQP